MAGPDRKFIPYVTYGLVAANVAYFAVAVLLGAHPISPTPEQLFDLGGNFGPVTLSGAPWRLFTSMFLHIGLIHLAVNMIGLYSLGGTVERMYGRAGYAAMYLFAGLAGSLASAARGEAVSAGASGALFGVMGAFGAFLLLHKDRLDRGALRQAVRGLIITLAINVWLGLSFKGIDMLAHVGGLFGGFVAGLVLQVGKTPTAHRTLRALAVAIVGSGLVIGASFVVPVRGLVTFEATKDALDVFTRRETTALDRYNALVNQGVSDAVMADTIEKEVLPTWREGVAALANLEGAPPELQTTLRAYAAAREAAFVAMVEALRSHDPAAVERAKAAMREAEVQAAKLSP